jgi:hypothetical protein
MVFAGDPAVRHQVLRQSDFRRDSGCAAKVAAQPLDRNSLHSIQVFPFAEKLQGARKSMQEKKLVKYDLLNCT